MILCTAANKVGTATTSTILNIQTPPTNAAISGPQTIHHEDESIYECAVDGGNPAPEIIWTIKDHLGNTKEVPGEMINGGLSRMTLKTGTDERGLSINCVGSNKEGIVSHTMHVNTHYLPQTIQITGPQTIQHEDESIYECAVDGGNPVPEITWTIKDHLGNMKKVAGEIIDQGLSRMTLKTGTDERMLSINCVGSNKRGIVSHTMHVNTHNLPQTVQITGPTTATPGQFAHFTCVTTETFPVPALTWKIEKSGDIAEVSEIDGEVSTEALEDGGVVAFAKIDISIEETMTHGLVQCLASLEGFGKKLSKQHTIDVITLEEPIEKLKEQEIKEDTSAKENNIKHIEKIVLKKPEMESIESKYFEHVNKLKENKNEESMHIFEDNKIA